MANVEAIHVLKREEVDGGRVRLHNEWVGKGEIPRVAQGIVRPEMVRWDDYAEWDAETQSCAWELKIRVFRESFRCSGRTRMVEEPRPGSAAGTRVVVAGTLEVSVRDVPGVPRILAGTIAPAIERFIVTMVTPNLEQINVSLSRYLDAVPKAS